MANERCCGIKADGGACRGIPIHGSAYCVAHHPDTQDARRRGAKKGGHRGGRSRPYTLIAELRNRLLAIADQVDNDEIDESKAAVMGRLLQFAIKSVKDEVEVREKVELEARLEEVEERLERQQGPGGRRWG